jgi:O-antigen ligase
LLGSRAALLTLLIVTIYYIWKLLRGFSFWVSIISTSLVLILLIVGMLNYTRIGETMKRNEKNSTTEIRISLWSDAFEVFKDAPLFGYGIGDGLNKMIDKHNENGNTKAGLLRLNAHNQYLETATQTGIVGLVSLFLILLIPLIISIRDRYELLFLCIVIISINFLFESMLVRLTGVLFLAFWLNFLLIIPNISESEMNY